MSDNPYQLHTLSRALDVLTLIESAPAPLTLTAIAERLDKPTPVI
ncbi:MAG: helix-turn-helix domain-containing protein, partial [Pikeienuella sp.]